MDELILIHIILTKHYILFRFHSFSLRPFSFSGSYLEYCITFSHHTCLVSSWLWKFLRLFVFDNLNRFEDYWLVTFVQCPSIGNDFLTFSSWLDKSLRVFRRKTMEVKCHFYYIISRIYNTNMTSLFMLILITSLGSIFWVSSL